MKNREQDMWEGWRFTCDGCRKEVCASKIKEVLQ